MPSNKPHLFLAQESGFTRSASPNCPVCNTPNADFASYGPYTTSGPPQLLQGWCPACTNVRIHTNAVNEVRKQKKGHLLSAYLRSLPAEAWKSERESVTVDNLEQIISSISELTILDQFDLALKRVCEMCPMVGLPSSFDYQTDWPLLTAQSADTALFILRELGRVGYLYQEEEPSCVPRKPTLKGYERLQQIQSTGRNSETGFVAMSFSSEQMPVWKDVIEPAVWDAGYRPFRVDRYEHTHRIDDEIIAQIKSCRFLVADFTEQKAGVYFEAGLALGLGRNVFWMCRDSEKDNLHFDTRQYNHIMYDDFGKARRDLTNRIVANEGPGNCARPKARG